MKTWGVEVQLDLGTRMEINGHLHTPGKNSRYPLDRRLGERHSRSGCCGEETILHLLGSGPWPSSP
jgi:hypothetical protein